VEWKEQMLEKLGKVDELVIQVQRVADVLERIAGMRLKTLEDDIISWPESEGEETETVERVNKGKQREQRSDGDKLLKKSIGDGLDGGTEMGAET